MNKKGKGGGGFFLILLLILIPMCARIDNTSYSDCVDDCKDIFYTSSIDNNFTIHYYKNETEVTKIEVKKFCYDECRLNNDEVKG